MFEFTCIEPVTAAIGALIDLDPPLGTEVVPMQFYPLASRAIAFAAGVDNDLVIPLNMKQRLTGSLVFFVDSLQFEGIKPYPAATALADIDFETADLNFF